MKVLVVNAGSSSLKYQLIDMETEGVIAKGLCERIGLDGSAIEHKRIADDIKVKEEISMPNHSVAMKIVVDKLTDKSVGVISNMDEIGAVGHRVVHGGPYFFESCVLNEEVLEKLNMCNDFAPLHTPAHLQGIKGCTDVMPDVCQVLVFDTAFHQTQPNYASTYGISKDIAQQYKIRRYGAHGTSHKYVSQEMNKILGTTDTKIVTCHIGNGSSVSAVKNGKCVDTSMGFTPLEGLLMGTRCGSMDPAVVTYIMKKTGMTPDEMSNYMNKKCGLLGVSGISSDSRDVEAAVLEGNPDAILAAEMLAYQTKKLIGAYAAAMDGVDAIVFTAGIGENSVEYRERVLKDLTYLGVDVDFDLNRKVRGKTVELSTEKSRVKVYIIPTNEELAIARDTKALAEGK